MSYNHDKKFYRKLKRELKKEGNKRCRRWLKQQLIENPEEAPYNEYDYENFSSKELNGMDRDLKRKNPPPPKGIQDPWFDSKYWIDIEERD